METNQQQNGQDQFTGRHLVLIDTSVKKSTINNYSKKAGIKFISSKELTDAVGMNEILSGSDGIIFDELGIGIVNDKPEEVSQLLSSNGSNPFYYSEPETYVYAISELDYLKGFKDAANQLYRVISEDGIINRPKTGPDMTKKMSATWGLVRTKTDTAQLTGKGINIAVLDTGFYGDHPDFIDRNIVGKSFISGEAWDEDRNGHGTHCIGTACGNVSLDSGKKYGIASGANIFVGKVLSNSGSGKSGGVIEGIDWAIKNGCQVISMSLGSPVGVGQKPSPIYEAVGKRALQLGSLIIAAAGNESRRPGLINPVASPANCKSILAVGAIDSQDDIAYFSNRGINPDGGKVDITAPGVDIFSSWSKLDNTQLYNTISGTSMATPHVAGIAALMCEAYPQATPEQIWILLIQNAEGIGLSVEDVGAGVAQAM